MSTPTNDEQMSTMLEALGVPELPPEIAKLAAEADEATVWHAVTGQLLITCGEMLAIIQASDAKRDPRMSQVLGRYASIARFLLTVRKPNTRFSAALDVRKEGGGK